MVWECSRIEERSYSFVFSSCTYVKNTAKIQDVDMISSLTNLSPAVWAVCEKV